MFMSREKRTNNRPVGLTLKNVIGRRKTFSNKLRCKATEARKPPSLGSISETVYITTIRSNEVLESDFNMSIVYHNVLYMQAEGRKLMKLQKLNTNSLCFQRSKISIDVINPRIVMDAS